MSSVPWSTPINFASALLLHSCITVLLKETLNLFEASYRLSLRCWQIYLMKVRDDLENEMRTSIVLDAYTSILSHDLEGELAELYFTNTGFILLFVSLASSVAMNMLLSSSVLNTIVAVTFGLAFLASMVNGNKELVLPVMALRRAGRFIWSDTPFVNFFSLIYIATVLSGQSTLRLQDYIAFRSIAVLELVFMKAKLAASSPKEQACLVRRLIASEWIVVRAPNCKRQYPQQTFQLAERRKMIAFSTLQRLSVMLLKTSISYHLGCLQGSKGPATVPAPEIGCYVDEHRYGWKIYRLSEDIMIIADSFAGTSPTGYWGRFIARAHGVLLRRLGKVRVIYLLRLETSNDEGHCTTWHSNINLVTGVSQRWLTEEFQLATNWSDFVVVGE